MKKLLFLLAFTSAGLPAAFAQKVKKTVGQAGSNATSKPLAGIPVFWGGQALLEAQKWSLTVLQSLLQQPLSVAADKGTLQGFAFTYAERGSYEDSVGNPIVLTDYLTEYCLGDTLSKNIKLLLPPRIKAGDTVYIANIKVLPPAGKPVMGRPVRIVLQP